MVAGLTVGVVALPLALAFGLASGLGARAGLITAIVAGLVAAVCGGSNVQVSGPTGAMAVVLAPVVVHDGAGAVVVVGAMAGLILVVAVGGAAGPVRVVHALAGDRGLHRRHRRHHLPAAGTQRPGRDQARRHQHGGGGRQGDLVGPAGQRHAGCAGRWPPWWPGSWRCCPACTGRSRPRWWRSSPPPPWPRPRTCRWSASARSPTRCRLPSLPGLSAGRLSALAGAALAVAALSGIESLLSAKVADGMADGPRHDPDRELFGQGLANMAVALFGGMPATGAIARTAVNVRAGARTRLAAIVHSLVLVARRLPGRRPRVADPPGRPGRRAHGHRGAHGRAPQRQGRDRRHRRRCPGPGRHRGRSPSPST